MYFAYRMNGPGEVEIRIYNVAGEPAGTVRAVHAASGTGRLSWPLGNVAPGVYLYRLRLVYRDGGVYTGPVRKFVVVK